MKKRHLTQFEYEAAQQERDTMRKEFFDVCPDVRLDAVTFTVAVGDGAPEVRATITGDTKPYTAEEVMYFAGEVGAKFLNTDA